MQAPQHQKDVLPKDIFEKNRILDWRRFEFVSMAVDGKKFKIRPKHAFRNNVSIGDWTYVCTHCDGFFLVL